MIGIEHYLVVSSILFVMGVLGIFLNRKNVIVLLMAIELNMPLLVFGHKGTGKTTDLLQIAARTGRRVMRVQHTGNTEESHITGQYVVRGGDLHFQMGVLAVAMQRGLMYIADEYDFARPEVLAVYQPVLEGEPLVITGPGEYEVQGIQIQGIRTSLKSATLPLDLPSLSNMSVRKANCWRAAC